MMEFHDRAQDIEDELQHVRGALLDDIIATLGPAEPICLPPTATVEDAIAQMLERRQACVLIVDTDRRLTGILTERDVLMRVAGAGREPRRTALRDVMTPNPVALTAHDRVAYAVHCMSVAGFRTVPLVDTERRDRAKSSDAHAEHGVRDRSEEHTSELQSPDQLVCRLLL